MSTKEQILQQDIRLELGNNPRIRMYRNNVGLAVPVGKGKRRPVQYGLCPGSSDLIGIRAVEITPEMVGRIIGQFVSLEVKTPNGTVSDDQAAFLRVMWDLGGLSIVARSLDDIKELV